ncbi:MAG: sigma-70 family RNA polymerase sigma factor, partial [Planctomycetota bacterium]
MSAAPEDLSFRRFKKWGDPVELAKVYDLTADRLLRAALHMSPSMAAAEDILQATFLAAMEAAPGFDESRPLMPWLMGILNKQAKLARWRDRREPDQSRLRVIRGPEGPEDSAREKELLAALERAIEELPEVYRPVVVLRLRHGLDAGEIAHALGRPPGTVRSQLSRATELVRKLLPTGLTGAIALFASPSRGLAAVREVVLAQVPAAPLIAAGAGATWTLGGLAMKRVILASALVVIGLAAGGSIMFGSEALSSDPSPMVSDAVGLDYDGGIDPIAEVAGGEESERETLAAPEAKPLVTQAEASFDRETGGLLVQVYWGKSTDPAEGVQVLLHKYGPRQWTNRISARTDGAGLARFKKLDPGYLSLEVLRGGEDRFLVAPGMERRVVMRIPPGIRVVGSVVDAEGIAVPGAEVWLSERWRTNRGEVVSQSDTEGRFVLRQVGGDRYLAVRAPGFEPSRLHSLKAIEGSQLDLQIVLARGSGSLEGVITAADGSPVVGAHVLVGQEEPKYDRRQESGTWTPGPPPMTLRSDPAGRFRAKTLEPGLQIVQVRASGYAPWSGSVDILADEHSSLSITMESGASLAGQVTNQAGEPIAFASLRAGGQGRFASTSVLSGQSGFYRIDDLPAGELELWANHPQQGKAEEKVTLTASLEATWSPILKWENPGEYQLHGRLIDHKGEPLPDWRVVAFREGSMTESMSAGVDSRGSFDVTVAWERVRVWAHPPRAWRLFPSVILEGVLLDGSALELRVPDPSLSLGRIRAKVLSPEGDPLLAELQVWHEEKRMWRSLMNDGQSGEFLVENIPPGACSLEIRSDGYPWLKLGKREIRAGEMLDLGTISLSAAGRIAGTVGLLGGGVPDALDIKIYQDGQEAAVAEYADGRFWSGPLAGGEYQLVVQGSRVGSLRRDLRVDAGQVLNLQLELSAAAQRHLRFTLHPELSRPRSLTVHLWDPRSKEVAWIGGIGPEGP